MLEVTNTCICLIEVTCDCFSLCALATLPRCYPRKFCKLVIHSMFGTFHFRDIIEHQLPNVHKYENRNGYSWSSWHMGCHGHLARSRTEWKPGYFRPRKFHKWCQWRFPKGRGMGTEASMENFHPPSGRLLRAWHIAAPSSRSTAPNSVYEKCIKFIVSSVGKHYIDLFMYSGNFLWLCFSNFHNLFDHFSLFSYSFDPFGLVSPVLCAKIPPCTNNSAAIMH